MSKALDEAQTALRAKVGNVDIDTELDALYVAMANAEWDDEAEQKEALITQHQSDHEAGRPPTDPCAPTTSDNGRAQFVGHLVEPRYRLGAASTFDSIACSRCGRMWTVTRYGDDYYGDDQS